ncbi:MAG: hypothetical protein K0Q51_598 [Rickettsiaceae bacterium]|jgi:hypothetical protein|nr:hypothetical protein [Rickettsiaceae bacterium]
MKKFNNEREEHAFRVLESFEWSLNDAGNLIPVIDISKSAPENDFKAIKAAAQDLNLKLEGSSIYAFRIIAPPKHIKKLAKQYRNLKEDWVITDKVDADNYIEPPTPKSTWGNLFQGAKSYFSSAAQQVQQNILPVMGEKISQLADQAKDYYQAYNAGDPEPGNRYPKKQNKASNEDTKRIEPRIPKREEILQLQEPEALRNKGLEDHKNQDYTAPSKEEEITAKPANTLKSILKKGASPDKTKKNVKFTDRVEFRTYNLAPNEKRGKHKPGATKKKVSHTENISKGESSFGKS